MRIRRILKRLVNAFSIGIFDSGAGGLSVLNACRAVLPREDFIYLADIAGAPYGNKTDEEIAARVLACCERLLELNCKAIVVACNTATNVGIKMLRSRYARPFVGLEPAVKPAANAGLAGETVLLCTEATARQEKFNALLQQCVAVDGGWRMADDKERGTGVRGQGAGDSGTKNEKRITNNVGWDEANNGGLKIPHRETNNEKRITNNVGRDETKNAGLKIPHGEANNAGLNIPLLRGVCGARDERSADGEESKITNKDANREAVKRKKKKGQSADVNQITNTDEDCAVGRGSGSVAALLPHAVSGGNKPPPYDTESPSLPIHYSLFTIHSSSPAPHSSLLTIHSPSPSSSPAPHSSLLTPNFPPPAIRVAPQKNLAALIEEHFGDLEPIRPQVYDILTPYKNAGAVILGCTHYVFVRAMIADFYRLQGKQIRIFDGNAGAAKRLKSLLKQENLLTDKKTAGSVRLIKG